MFQWIVKMLSTAYPYRPTMSAALFFPKLLVDIRQDIMPCTIQVILQIKFNVLDKFSLNNDIYYVII